MDYYSTSKSNNSEPCRILTSVMIDSLTPMVVYAPLEPCLVSAINIANTGSEVCNYCIYINPTNYIFDKKNVLHYNIMIEPNQSYFLDFGDSKFMMTEDGAVGASASIIGCIALSIFGRDY